MRASHFMWAILTIAVGVALFLLKHKVQELEHQLVAKRAQIVRDRGAIRVLEAEWTYLNNPERLRRQSEEYLGFHPPAPGNVATIASLPFKAGQGDAAPQVNFETPTPPAAPATSAIKAPQLHTELQPPVLQTASTERPSILSVTYARLQRLLLPTAAGATTPLFAGDRK
ncbi:MAG: cell division protein FtsL [Rhodospirillaceae bacterium]